MREENSGKGQGSREEITRNREEKGMITSTSNAQVKDLVRLQKKARARDEEGVFLVEGTRLTGEVPVERIARLYVSESYTKKNSAFLSEMNASGIRAEVMTDTVFAHVSDTKTPQGILAVVRRVEYDFQDLLGSGKGVKESRSESGIRQERSAAAPHVLVLDNLQDPGNLGTIFRTAEAAGATGILLSRDCVDIYNPKVIRSTMGAVFRMPFLYVEDLQGAIQELKAQGVHVYAAHLEGRHAYDEENYQTGCAFLIGNEGNGLREEIAACADIRIRIPMEGQAESLNAAVAAAVLMFEAARQRR